MSLTHVTTRDILADTSIPVLPFNTVDQRRGGQYYSTVQSRGEVPQVSSPIIIIIIVGRSYTHMGKQIR